MQLAKLLSLVVLISLVTSVDAVAQLRERWSARREAREERLNRLEQAASPRNFPQPNPQQSRAMPANPSASQQGVANANRTNPSAAALGQQRANPNARNAAPLNTLRNGTTTAGKVTTAAASSTVSKSAKDSESDKVGSDKSVVVPDPIPKNTIGYRGPGVKIEVPEDIEGEVKFLIDDTEVLALKPGEQTILKNKREYIVRFSRGETKEKSFGEARYTITEGTYRFAVTVRGWELYRQPDATNTEIAEKTDDREQSSSKVSNGDAAQLDKLRPTELDLRKDRKEVEQPDIDQVEELPRPEPRAAVVVPEPKPKTSKKEEPKSILER